MRRRLRLEDEEQQREGGVIEDRADRPEEQHEAPDVVDPPLARFEHVLFIHAVEGDGELREVVEEVLGEELDGEHGQERQERARAQDAEHVPEVRAGPHLDVLDDVAEYAASFEEPVLQHQQVLLQQDEVGRFLRDIDRVVHRDADVGRAERGCVVDAVAHEADDVTVALERAHDPFLVRR